ncbi:MAG: amylo-alpha-1,6-glucosidase [Sphingomonadaceae bacterium]
MRRIPDEWLALAVRLAAVGLAEIASGDFLLASSRSEFFGRLFGRDSLITSMQFLSAIDLDPTLAPVLLPPIEGSLRALAQLQGVIDDPWTEEEPGKIPHEYNPDGEGDFPGAYYASIDATPLFLVTLHRYAVVIGKLASSRTPPGSVPTPALHDQPGGPPGACAIPPLLVELRDSRDRALRWLLERADLDGDDLTEFLQRNPERRSLINQNWKDSRDSLLMSDGTIPPYPVAYAEVQAYCYGALLGEADLRHAEDPEFAAGLRASASRLADRFERRFWLPETGSYAQALDARKRPLTDVSSNGFHWLWLGPTRPRRHRRAARRLLEPDLRTPFGVRTLSSRSPNYAPLRYHRGTIWPWDNWVAASALRRLCMDEEAAGIDAAVLRALAELGCPAELYSYLDGEKHPSMDFHNIWGGRARSCRIQAWTVGYLVEMVARWGRGEALRAEVGRVLHEGQWTRPLLISQ